MNRVFVYGTLKQGQPNRHYLEGTEGKWTFVGTARTAKKWPLIIGTPFNMPFILDIEGEGNHVLGEVYDIDEEKLKVFDNLEEHPEFYTRVQVEAEYLDSPGAEPSERQHCWVYMLLNPRKEVTLRESFTSYDSLGPHGLGYIPRKERAKLINLPDLIALVKEK